MIEWFVNIKNKESSSFIVFDMENFYPSISEDLFKSAIKFAKESIDISDYNLSFKNQARKTLVFMKMHRRSKTKARRILMSVWVVLMGQKCANLSTHTS